MIQISALATGNEGNRMVAQSPKTCEIVSGASSVHQLFEAIDFSNVEPLSEEVFATAMKGYNNLVNAGKIDSSRHLISIADFTKPSTKNRLWVIDLAAKKVLYNTYVAHGQGSGMDMATRFSNQDGTHASSLGFYVTAGCYNGNHGNSLRLDGMDQGYNDAALARGIVMHAAEYVSEGNVAGQGRLGRSWGCPAVNPKLAQPIINTIKGGTCLFIYHSTPQYLASSKWLKRNDTAAPETNTRIASSNDSGAMKNML
jgi:hypothetical protein